jgi:hypothetical protein
MLVAAVAVMTLVAFATEDRGRTALGPALGADFTAFYAAGKLFAADPPARAYDWTAHTETFRALFPNAPRDRWLPFVQGPLAAVVLRPLAALPYAVAFAAWMAIALACVVGGTLLVLRTLPRLGPEDRRTALFLTVAFEPVLVETVVGGQFAGWAYLAFAAALAADRRGRSFTAGVALGVLLYKPPLLALAGVGLVAGRRWRTVAGVVAGVGLAAAVSLAVVGVGGGGAWMEGMLRFAERSGGGESFLASHKYVDLQSFARLLVPARPATGRVLALGGTTAAVVVLAFAWWRHGRDDARRPLLWGATLAWTPVVGGYGPVYDTALVALALLVAGDTTVGPDATHRATFLRLLAAVAVVPWVTQPLAIASGVQTYTLVLLGVGAWLLRLAHAGPPAGMDACALAGV